MKKLTILPILFLAFYTGNVFADDLQTISPSSKYEKYVDESVGYANAVIRPSKNHFVCAGIGMIDQGSALDRPTYFFKDDSRELICISAMGECIAGDPKQRDACRKICPPLEWEANDCSTKYSEHRKLESSKWQQMNDKGIKK